VRIWRRWRSRRREDLHARLVVDIRSTTAAMSMVVADAERLGIEVPAAVQVTPWVWGAWANRLEEQ
jgi:hypothetical protein